MIRKTQFKYKPADYEAEKASNSYLMSLIGIVVGLPLPIVNLICTFVFYYVNRKSTYFVRWHCTQALVSQFILVIVNNIAFWWTVYIFFGDSIMSKEYIIYLMLLICFNIFEFIITIYTAIETRKGINIEWWLYARITDKLVKQ